MTVSWRLRLCRRIYAPPAALSNIGGNETQPATSVAISVRAAATTPVQRLGVVLAHLTQPYALPRRLLVNAKYDDLPASGEANKAALKAECARTAELGIIGAPSLVTGDGEVFWGNDRLEQGLDWAAGRRIKQD